MLEGSAPGSFIPVNWHVEGISRTDADYSDKALRYLLQKDYTDFYLRDHFRADYYLSKNTCIFEGIVQLLLNSSTAGKDALLTGCICRLLDQLNDSSCYDIVALKKEKSNYLFEQIAELMRSSYGKISRKQLIEKLNYSGDYLNEIVKKHTNMNITQYRNSMAMYHASYLLLNTTKTIAEICMELEFVDQTYFYRIFKEIYGMTPKTFRISNGYYFGE